jgi:CRP/FNR family cyclic AMP-dependent transcriptional regulator
MSATPASRSDPLPAPAPHPRAGSLPRELLDELVRAGTVRQVPRNTLVVVQGEPARTLYVIVEGRVRVFVSDDNGKEAELNVMGEGEYFGELMLASHRRTASVTTLVPCRLCAVDRETFERILAGRPDLAFHLIQTLIERVKALTDSVSSLALRDVYGRVAQLFLELAQTVDGRQRVPAMSQQAIAERVGASRSMINRILKDLTKGGYLTVGKDHIELHRALPRRW